MDLNHPHLLATDGLPPSEGNPQFHQQMTYAVAMTTIRHFERALGRPAQWASRRFTETASGRDEFVRRLRIHPHALREANAYYSPEKVALLFGYFPAPTAGGGRNLPGGMVFTCLSHDIVAHETTHALLDGMHRRFVEPSNPDVLAFHEAFADIVALFQHFTFPDVLRHQIARTRGDLATQNLLGELAQQFGEASGRSGALRSALGQVDAKTRTWKPLEPDPEAYQREREPHARGAILVAAVFDAFLSIYKARIADLLRIATGGTGRLPDGELHPDLVNRLAGEAAKVSGHVLTMCIRALDYCPSMDVTFGEYLRAMVTADADLVPDDDLGYRVSLIDAFRRRGIFPDGVRSLAEDSLLWQGPVSRLDGPRTRRSGGRARSGILHPLDLMEVQQEVGRWKPSSPRALLFRRAQRLREQLHGWFAGLLDVWDPALLEDLSGLALRPGKAQTPLTIERDARGLPRFEVHGVWPARRVGPDGRIQSDLVIALTQKRRGHLDPDRQGLADAGRLPGSRGEFTFRGGCTLVMDLETAEPRYFIRKNILSADRLERQRRWLAEPDSATLRATYFGGPTAAGQREPFALLNRDL